MSTIGDINRNIAYVSGPEGQTVVIVRPRRVTTQKEADTCICHVCITISILLSTICLLLGIIYGSMILSLGKLSYKNDSWLITATFWFLGIGGFFVLTSLCIGKYIENIKAERRRRFMYTAGDSEFQTPYLMQDITQDQSSLGGQGELHSQGYDALPEEYARYQSSHPSAMRHQIPSEGYDPALYSFEQRSPSSSRYQTQFNQPGRAYPGMMSSGFSSPFRSSPVTERSFSPASDSTYLSYYSTRPEAHTVPMN